MEPTPFEVLVTVRVTGTTSPAGNHSVFYKDVEVTGVSVNTNLTVVHDTAEFAKGVVESLLHHGGKP